MSLKTERREHLEHYELEVELASRLRTAAPEHRSHTYTEVYDELFRRLPDHPQLRIDAADRQSVVAGRLRLVRRFSDSEGVLVEIGAGDGLFSTAAAALFRRVVAVDVSSEILQLAGKRPNLELLLTDGVHLPLETASADVAISDQLMEHLHPDDAEAQLAEIARVLRPGGRYVCITPNRATGPHDISGLYDDVARGFHLREYTSGELAELFVAAGFAEVQFYAGGKGHYLPIPRALLRALERTLLGLPGGVRRVVRGSLPAHLLLGLTAVGRRK